MNTTIINEIEDSISQLTLSEQLWLLERLAHHLRKKSLNQQQLWANDLVAMAHDPEIQSELQQIAEEFAFAEADGLEMV